MQTRTIGVSPRRVTLAWLLAKAPVVIPIPGASRPDPIIGSAPAPESHFPRASQPGPTPTDPVRVSLGPVPTHPDAETVMTNVAQVPATEVPAGAYLLDVREHEEWDAGHAPGAVHIPLGELGARYTELNRDLPLYVICRSGYRSDHAAQALAGAGWDASNVSDGMMGWQAAGLPMTSESGQAYVA